MKKFILALLAMVCVSAFAKKDEIILPQIYNYGFNLQITIWNPTDKYVTCTGSLTYTTQSNAVVRESLFEMVAPRYTTYKTIYPRDYSDRIAYYSSSIYCY